MEEAMLGGKQIYLEGPEDHGGVETLLPKASRGLCRVGQAGVYCGLCRPLWYQRPLPGGGQGPSGKPRLGHTLLQYFSDVFI